jgi:hypothetical protein
MDAIIPAIVFAKFVNQDAALRYAIKHSAHDGMITAPPAAKPAPVQEPVAYRSLLASGSYTYCNTPQFFDNAQALYTTPPAQPAPVQPVAWREALERIADPRNTHFAGDAQVVAREALATPPAAPVLEGRDWSLLEATQESLREHMAEIKRLKEAQPAVPLTDEMRKQMKERCDSMEMRGAFADGWLSAEAAHGITKGQP